MKLLDQFESKIDYQPNKLDCLLTARLLVLLKYKNKTIRKIKSREIYEGFCSRQNWYYRILTSPKRLQWILEQVFLGFRSIQATFDRAANFFRIEKPLYTKTNRLNYSEALRRLRFIEICLFLNFTTKH